jgi:hypothetical protein
MPGVVTGGGGGGGDGGGGDSLGGAVAILFRVSPSLTRLMCWLGSSPHSMRPYTNHFHELFGHITSLQHVMR